MIKAIIFDLDDTLYSEFDYAESGFKLVARAMSEKYRVNISPNQLMEMLKEDYKNVYNRLLDSLNIKYTVADIVYFVNVYRANHIKKGELKLFDGIREMLNELKEKYKLGIITDGRVESQNAKIDSLDIREYFDEIIITDELGIEYRKPHPKAFEIIHDKFNVNWEEMMYIGDNRAKDFAIGAVYPIKTVEVGAGKIHITNEYKDNIKPNYIIKNVVDIKDIL